MREFVSSYQKDKVIPMIVNAFKREGISLDPNFIKIWNTPYMLAKDVIRGIESVKSQNSKVIVYTNTVPLKKRLINDFGIKIYDITDLRKMAERHGDYDLHDEL
jgi:hypothetical protein